MARQGPNDARRLARIEELFNAARAMPAAERQSWLASASGVDPDLAREVLELLAYDVPTEFFERSVAEELRELAEETDGCPEEIAGFRVLRRLGVGGMGVVFEVEQPEPRRRIALKLMRGMLAPSARERFAREIELLALLDHPNIAKILFAGRTPSDQPYLAMELVEGPTLSDWARGAPSRQRRLDLVEKLARAIEHAHQRGVLHRDLKPANILVAAEDEPKIIDFGVARLVDASGRAQLTVEREVVGTLPYMSPERFRGRTAAIDTRADVYALGVIAYELLAGALPYDFEGKGLIEVVRMLDGGEPLPLSYRDASLRGDLEAIVSRAIDPDPDRRYASASLLALDLEHLRRNEPVSATSTTRFYLLRKLVRRHRGLAAGIAIAIVALVVGLAIALIALDRSRAAEGEARVAEAAADRERAAALVEARTADEVARRLAWVLEAAPRASLSSDVRFVDVLDLAASQLQREMQVRPEVESAVRFALARAFLQVGRTEEAHVQLARAEALGPAPIAVESDGFVWRLLRLQLEVERGRHAEAQELAARLIEEALHAEGPGSNAALDARDLRWRSQRLAGERERALSEARAFCAQAERLPLGEHRDLQRVIGRLGLAEILFEERDFAAAKRIEVELAARELQRILDARSDWSRRFDALRAGLTNAWVETKLDASPPPSWRNLLDVARGLASYEQPARAELVARRAYEQLRAAAAPNPEHLSEAAALLARSLSSLGRHAEVVPLYEECLAVAELAGRPEAARTARVNLVLALERSARPEDALARSEQLVDELARAQQSVLLFEVLRVRGKALGALGRYEAGERDLLRAVEVATERGRAPAEVPELVELYEAWGKPEQAARWRAGGR